jgi:transposase
VDEVKRIFVDTSKSVFQLHGVDAGERVVVRRTLRRGAFLEFFRGLPPTVVGLEACGASHFWARELEKLGHEARLFAPQYVKAYLKRNKNDGRDAEAGCEAMSRPTMRTVPVKSEAQQAVLMLVGMRDGLVRERTRLTNAIRGHAAEFGLAAAKGLDKVAPLLARIAGEAALPELARALFAELGEALADLEARIGRIERRLLAQHRRDEVGRRLAAIPGVGPIGATMLAAKTPAPRSFASGRAFAAWMGLTPKDHSTAGKRRLGSITRAGDEALRATLVCGAMAVIRQVKAGRRQPSPWLAALLARKEPKEAAVALANKTARIAWKLMVSGQAYEPERAAARPSAIAA